MRETSVIDLCADEIQDGQLLSAIRCKARGRGGKVSQKRLIVSQLLHLTDTRVTAAVSNLT